MAVTMIVSALVGVVGLALDEASSPVHEGAPPAAAALPVALPAPTPTFEQQREKVVLFLRQLNQVGNSFEDSLEAANFGGRLASGDPAQIGAAVATFLELTDGLLRRVGELAPPPEVPDLAELRSAILSSSQKAQAAFQKVVSAAQSGNATQVLQALQQLDQLDSDPDAERASKIEESLMARFNIPDREVDYRRPAITSADAPTPAALPTPAPTPRGTPLPPVLAPSTPVTKDQRQDLQDTNGAFVSFAKAVSDGRVGLESGSGLSFGFTRGDSKTIIDVFPTVGPETSPGFKSGVTPLFRQVGNATIRGIKGNFFYVLKKSPAGSSFHGPSGLKRLGLGSPYPVVEALNQGNALVALETSHHPKGQATLRGDQVPVYPAVESLAQGDAGIVFETSEPPGGRVIIQGDRVTLLDQNGSILGQFSYEGHNVEQEVQEVLDSDVAPPDEQNIAWACQKGASSTSNARVFVASVDRVESVISRGKETSSQAIHQLGAQQVRLYDCENKEHRHRFSLDIQGDTSSKVGFQGLVYVQNPPLPASTAKPTPTPTPTPRPTPSPTLTRDAAPFSGTWVGPYTEMYRYSFNFTNPDLSTRRIDCAVPYPGQVRLQLSQRGAAVAGTQTWAPSTGTVTVGQYCRVDQQTEVSPVVGTAAGNVLSFDDPAGGKVAMTASNDSAVGTFSWSSSDVSYQGSFTVRRVTGP